MSISSTLYTCMSSLFCLEDKIGTIGDNIANINTTGFKANQVNFEDILFEATHTGGVRITDAGVTSNFSVQGSVQASNIATNMAISGDGFFILRDSEDTGSTYYTRAGEFYFDADNERTEPESYLINPGGYRVQGYKFDNNGTEETALTDIRLELTTPAPTIYDSDPAPRLISTPKASTRLTLISNLDANGQDNSPGGLFAGGLFAGGLLDNWDGTQDEPISSNHYEYRVEQDIYDSSGDRHSIAVYYDKTGTDNVWEYLITCLEGVGTNTDDGVLARGNVTFDNFGYINDMSMGTTTPDDNGYLAFQTPFAGANNIEFDMGARFINDYWQPEFTTTTRFESASYTKTSNTDGYGESDLMSFSVSSDGIIGAIFENSVTSDLFRVGLAGSTDPSSRLRRIGSTLYQEVDPESGGLITGIPGSSGLGAIIGSSLETSNVDLAEQFGDLIFTQRAFQANSKGMVTADEMLKTLVALKR